MNRLVSRQNWLGWSFALLVVGGLLYAGAGSAQEAKPAVAKPAAAAKGRLPAYYKDVVTEEQRQKIYAVQLKYDKQIDDLMAQLNDLRAKRDAEVEAVLSPEQKTKLEQIRAAAAGKKSKAGEAAPKSE